METSLVPSSDNSTILNDRILWFDGDYSVNEDKILQLLATGQSAIGMCVTSITPEVKRYNQLVSKDEQITTKTKLKDITTNWKLPEEYYQLDPIEYVMDKFNECCTDMSEHDRSVRETRIATELLLYKKLQLFDVLRVLIYIINTLNKNDVVWGVGRGSSVSSYVLFVIGVHDIDSVKYDLDIDDFLRA